MKLLFTVFLLSLSVPELIAQHLNVKLTDLRRRIETMQGMQPGQKHYSKSDGFDFLRLKPLESRGNFSFNIMYNDKDQIDAIDVKEIDGTIWTFECYFIDRNIIYMNILVGTEAKSKRDTVIYASMGEFMILDVKKEKLVRFDRENSDFVLLDSFLRPVSKFHLVDDKIVSKQKVTENNEGLIVVHLLPRKDIFFKDETTLSDIFKFLTTDSDFVLNQKILLEKHLQAYDFQENMKIINSSRGEKK